eukprot:1979291-Rhodomonas_salina.1
MRRSGVKGCVCGAREDVWGDACVERLMCGDMLVSRGAAAAGRGDGGGEGGGREAGRVVEGLGGRESRWGRSGALRWYVRCSRCLLLSG